MSIRTDTISAKLDRFLARYDAPKSMADNAQAQIDETAALLRAIDRAAPANGYDDWWLTFEDKLAETLRTRAWPTVGDIVKAAERMPKHVQNVVAIRRDGPDSHELQLQAQLRAWRDRNAHCGTHVVTRERCIAIGMAPHEADRAVAYAADPYNWGVDPTLSHDDRVRNRAKYEPRRETDHA